MANYITLFYFVYLTLTPLQASSIMGKVIAIHDGDTITLLPAGDNKKAKLRLLGVDTPEIDFNGFSQGEMAIKSRDFLQSLLQIGTIIEIELATLGTDSNGRLLGVIKFQGEDLNAKILKAGWGVPYFIFPYNKSLVASYLKISQEAHTNSLGMFSSKFKNEPLPYIFRQESKGIPGTNFIGNFITKKLYNSEQIEETPFYQRVFFPTEQMARSAGFTW